MVFFVASVRVFHAQQQASKKVREWIAPLRLLLLLLGHAKPWLLLPHHVVGSHHIVAHLWLAVLLLLHLRVTSSIRCRVLAMLATISSSFVPKRL